MEKPVWVNYRRRRKSMSTFKMVYAGAAPPALSIAPAGSMYAVFEVDAGSNQVLSVLTDIGPMILSALETKSATPAQIGAILQHLASDLGQAKIAAILGLLEVALPATGGKVDLLAALSFVAQAAALLRQ